MDKACIEIRDLMALGTDVSAHERIAIESHVSVCAECARELEDARALRGNLALLREGDMPAGASERIWSRVRAAVPGSRRSRIATWSVRAAAVLLLGVTLGYTTKSIAASKASPEHPSTFADDSDSRPTIVPRVLYREGTGTGANLAPPSVQPAPGDTRVLHYLPLVDEIFEPGVVRF
jgi:hypothetical protein